MVSHPRFSRQTIPFIDKASRQKDPEWLDKHRDEYEKLLLHPLQHLAGHLKIKLGQLAPNYHFPQKGIGRLKRSANRVAEGGGLFKDWVTYSASRPRESRFDHNPNLFFLIQTDEPEGDNVLVAGGLYMPSSRQIRAIREAIAHDASPFDRLFASKAFAARFPGGFSDEKISTRNPKGFAADHPRMDWLKLQAFFVWHPYTMREFTSAEFPELITEDWRQILRLNELLEFALKGQLAHAKPPAKSRVPKDLSSRLEGIEAPRRKMDF